MKLMTSIPYAQRSPARAMITPPIAGPTTAAPFHMI
jgi:hypothetical protein